MRIPLQYQRTDYDCGPTSLLNAINFLLPREDIPPDILRYVMMYTLDCYNDRGEACKNGTSRMAMQFLSSWLNQYAKATKFPLRCHYLSGEQVNINADSKVVEALQQGGAVVLRLYYDCWHYVTLTGMDGESIKLFDPYFRKRPFHQPGIRMIDDKPFTVNRQIDYAVLNQTRKSFYSLGPAETREAILIFNSITRRSPESTIEYFI